MRYAVGLKSNPKETSPKALPGTLMQLSVKCWLTLRESFFTGTDYHRPFQAGNELIMGPSEIKDASIRF